MSRLRRFADRAGSRLRLGGELARFLWSQKLVWLAPLVLVLLAVGGILLLASQPVVGPFVYTLF